jgi:hypothetical protein
MEEQVFAMKSEVVGHLQWLMIFFKVLSKKSVTAFHNFRPFVYICTNVTRYSLRDYHRLGCHKLWARQIPKIFTGEHKTQIMTQTLTFIAKPHWRLWISRSHHTSNTYWSQRAAKTVDEHTYSQNQPKSISKPCLLSRKFIATLFWDGKWELMVEFMQGAIMSGLMAKH